MLVDMMHRQDRRSYDLEWFLNTKTILRQGMFSNLIGQNGIPNLSKQLEFIDENSINTIETMYNSYDIKYCNLDHETDNNRTSYKTSDIIRYIDMIQSGFSAGKLENQIESTNFARDISTLFEQGVTL